MACDFSHPMWARVDRSGGPAACWPFTGRARTGTRRQYGQTHGHTAHRVAFEAWYGIDVPSHLVVRHDCDVPLCCNPAHLRVGTTADNARDATVRGRLSHKLSTVKVLEVFRSTEPAIDVAVRLGVSRSLVYLIRSGHRWSHVTGARPASR